MPSLLHRQGMVVRSSGVRLHWSVDSGNTAAATEASMYDAQHFSTEKKSCPNPFLSNTTKRSQHIFFLTSQRAAFIIHDFYQT